MITIENVITVKNAKRYKGSGINIGRPHLFGNPYTWIPTGTKASFVVATREEAIAKYSEWFKSQLNHPDTQRGFNLYLDTLAGIIAREGHLILICWCTPLPCHANIVAGHVFQKLNQNYDYNEQTKLWSRKP